MSYGIQLYGPRVVLDDGTVIEPQVVFSENIRTSNIQLRETFSLAWPNDTIFLECPDASDTDKIIVSLVRKPANLNYYTRIYIRRISKDSPTGISSGWTNDRIQVTLQDVRYLNTPLPQEQWQYKTIDVIAIRVG